MLKHLDERQLVVKYPPGKVIEPGNHSSYLYLYTWCANDVNNLWRRGVCYNNNALAPKHTETHFIAVKVCAENSVSLYDCYKVVGGEILLAPGRFYGKSDDTLGSC